LFLSVVGLLAAVIPYWYATFRQLNLETIMVAKARWEECKPQDYNLTVRQDREKSRLFRVRVRAGKNEEASQDGVFGSDLVMNQISISSLFEQLQEWAGEKTQFDYLIADFHPVLGYPVRIVWRRAGGIREEWVVRLDVLLGP